MAVIEFMSNPNQAVTKRNELKDLLDTRYKNRLETILRERAPQFAAALVQVVNRSWQLQKCKPESVIGAAITAAALDLSIEPALGEAHLVPYADACTFQIGYRGITQLALRSGQYKRMGNCPVRQGQLKKWNRLTGELEIDFEAESDGTVIGYAAWFQLINGFERGNYWTEAECMAHAGRFSASLKGKRPQESPWVTHKEKMCLKTVWIDLIRPWGPKSVQMQAGLAQDGTVRKNPDAEPEFIDIGAEPESQPQEQSPAENITPLPTDPPKANGNGNHPPEMTQQQHLEHYLVKDCGISFEAFRKWAGNQDKNADSWADFSQVPEPLAARLLRNKSGMKEQLSKV
jgi:recombination protein RecT